MKIILAIDGSEHSKMTVEEIAGRTFPPKTEVRIVTAYTKPSKIVFSEDGMMSEDYYPEINRIALKSATSITKDATKILHKSNLTLVITSAVIDGSPAQAILREAEAFDADLIVVGSHGHGAVAGFLLGSVSQAVALHAKCSVEIVRNEKTKQ
ncbi:MAG: universal stress protein [Ferruginibacter sp.]|jgi:nucleotide-binding universal stress UspA family protein